jgi:non-specific protein-tyrosine kinase
LLAALVGMMVVMGMIILIDTLDDSIRSPEQVTQRLGLPVLTVITHYTGEDGKPITEVQPRSMVSEAFRTLRTNIQYASVDSPVHTVMVTSANPNEGKTTVAVNLAVVLAQGGRKVTLVDADMRHPTIHKKFDNLNHVGLSTLFVQSLDSLDGSMQPTRIENLSIVTAGDLPPNPSELLGSHKMEQIINFIKESSDVIVLDTPPVMAVTDAMVLVPWVDGVLLVIESGQTRLNAARRTVEQLRRANANILGVVFNNLDLHDPRYGSQYYHYGKDGRHAISKYYFSETGEKKKKKSGSSKAD